MNAVVLITGASTASDGTRPKGWRGVAIACSRPCGISRPAMQNIEQVQQIFDVNFFSVVRVNRAVLPSMRQRGSAPDAPGSDEVAEAFVRLVEMPLSERPFRTVVSPAIEQLLESYNTAAEELRPIVAGIFNVPALAGPPRVASGVA